MKYEIIINAGKFYQGGKKYYIKNIHHNLPYTLPFSYIIHSPSISFTVNGFEITYYQECLDCIMNTENREKCSSCPKTKFYHILVIKPGMEVTKETMDVVVSAIKAALKRLEEWEEEHMTDTMWSGEEIFYIKK
jgi:hypothetical protein